MKRRVQAERRIIVRRDVSGAGGVIRYLCGQLHIRLLQPVIGHSSDQALHGIRRLRRQPVCEAEIPDPGLRGVSRQVVAPGFITADKISCFAVDLRHAVLVRPKAVAAGVQRFVKRLICRVADALRRDQKRAVPVGSEVKPAVLRCQCLHRQAAEQHDGRKQQPEQPNLFLFHICPPLSVQAANPFQPRAARQRYILLQAVYRLFPNPEGALRLFARHSVTAETGLAVQRSKVTNRSGVFRIRLPERFAERKDRAAVVAKPHRGP